MANEYVCIKKCYLNRELWSPGKTLVASKLPSNKFKLVKRGVAKVAVEDKQGNSFSEMNNKNIEEERKMIKQKMSKGSDIDTILF